MKLKLFFSVFTLPFILLANEQPVEIGAKVMFGGRYDDVRMCVASDASVKGGIIADIMFLTRFPLSETKKISLEIPLMRPIIFATAFEMLQFEPQVTLELKKELKSSNAVIAGPGLGMSFHYGPDYKSDKDLNRGEPFWAIGPMISATIGIANFNDSGNEKRIGIRAFYIPLFETSGEKRKGNVLGAVVEAHFSF